MRTPRHEPRSPHDRATCEHVFDALVRDGPVVDTERIVSTWGDDPRLVRYSRDTLNMFAGLGEVDHVRRSLWVVRPTDGGDNRGANLLRLAAASRACGSWVVAAGGWALELHGVIRAGAQSEDDRVAFVLTPRRSRPATYGSSKRDEPDALPVGANAARHVTPILDRPIAAVTRPTERIGNVVWIGTDELGGHVLDIPDAFISLVEHPRLSGGFAAARDAALPTLGRVGIDAVVDRARDHPVVAVRRRLAFVLMDAVMRTSGCATWFELDPWDRSDDAYQRWWIPRALGLEYRNTVNPTTLDPHRERIGHYVPSLHLIDNRDAPLANGRRPTRAMQPLRQAPAMIDPWTIIHEIQSRP